MGKWNNKTVYAYLSLHCKSNYQQLLLVVAILEFWEILKKNILHKVYF